MCAIPETQRGLSMRRESKVAMISVGAHGMGAEEARLFAREGATVVIGDVLEDESLQLEAADEGP